MKTPAVFVVVVVTMLFAGCKLPEDAPACESVHTYHYLSSKEYAVSAYFNLSFSLFDTLSFASNTDTLTFARQPVTSSLYTESHYQKYNETCMDFDSYENGKVVYASINSNDSLVVIQDMKLDSLTPMNAIRFRFNGYTFFAYREWLGNASHLTYIPEYKPQRNTGYYSCNIIYADSMDTTSSRILLQRDGLGILSIYDKQRDKTYALLNPFYH